MGMLDFLKKGGKKEELEKPVEKYNPPLENKIANLSPQGRASAVFNSRKVAEKMNFPGVPWNSVGRYIDGIVRGEDKEYVTKKCGLDFDTAATLDRIMEKEVDKILY